MKYFISSSLFIVVFIMTSCAGSSSDEVVDTSVPPEKKEFVMYEQSEMTAVMLHMYQVNEQLKSRIVSGEDIGDFSAPFERILTAQQTGNKEMDAFFKSHAETFLALQRSIYENPDTAAEQFNVAVTACIACHQVKCPGPIQKIEKLYIK